MTAQVRYDVVDGVCTLTLDNPERRNAWNPTMEAEYFAALDRAAADAAVRAIVVTGAGSTFCPGVDPGGLERAAGSDGVQFADRRPQLYAITVPKPIIAAINGGCAGIGLVQALACDVRFMARGAKLSTAYVKLGIPAEHGLSWLLPRLIGTEWALDLLLSGRRVDSAEAQRIGLVTRVSDDEQVLADAQAYAGELARTSSPTAMATIRRQVWGDLSRSFSDANAVWLEAMKRLNGSNNPDFAEGVAAMTERRLPNFRPVSPDAELPPLPRFADQ